MKSWSGDEEEPAKDAEKEKQMNGEKPGECCVLEGR